MVLLVAPLGMFMNLKRVCCILLTNVITQRDQALVMSEGGQAFKRGRAAIRFEGVRVLLTIGRSGACW